MPHTTRFITDRIRNPKYTFLYRVPGNRVHRSPKKVFNKTPVVLEHGKIVALKPKRRVQSKRRLLKNPIKTHRDKRPSSAKSDTSSGKTSSDNTSSDKTD